MDKSRVHSIPVYQIIVRSLLEQFSLIQHEDPVSVSDSRKAMGDDYGCDIGFR